MKELEMGVPIWFDRALSLFFIISLASLRLNIFLLKAPSRESAIPKPPQLKRRPDPLPRPNKPKIPNLSPTISKLPDFKPKSRPVINADKLAPPKKLAKEDKSRISSQETNSSETKTKKPKKEKDVDQQDLAAIKKKNEEYEISFKKVSKLFYDWKSSEVQDLPTGTSASVLNEIWIYSLSREQMPIPIFLWWQKFCQWYPVESLYSGFII